MVVHCNNNLTIENIRGDIRLLEGTLPPGETAIEVLKTKKNILPTNPKRQMALLMSRMKELSPQALAAVTSVLPAMNADLVTIHPEVLPALSSLSREMTEEVMDRGKVDKQAALEGREEVMDKDKALETVKDRAIVKEEIGARVAITVRVGIMPLILSHLLVEMRKAPEACPTKLMSRKTRLLPMGVQNL